MISNISPFLFAFFPCPTALYRRTGSQALEATINQLRQQGKPVPRSLERMHEWAKKMEEQEDVRGAFEHVHIHTLPCCLYVHYPVACVLPGCCAVCCAP